MEDALVPSMKITFHVGPHKTGTTSIQAALLCDFGREKPLKNGVWYPKPQTHGPGHAAFAFDKSGDLQRIVDAAEKARTKHLILSSEAFAEHYRQRVRYYAQAFLGHEVHLIATHNDLIRRATSHWQEMLKHGHMDDFGDLLRSKILHRPGYQPDLLATYAEALVPTRISIIHSAAEEPNNALIERVYRAIGLRIAIPGQHKKRLNARMNLLEAEILRSANKVLHKYSAVLDRDASTKLRNAIRRAFENDPWRTACPEIEIPPPSEEEISLINQRVAEIEAARDNLRRHWPVETFR